MVNKPSQKKKRYGKQGTIKYGYIYLQAEQIWIYPIKYFIYKSTFECMIILYTYTILQLYQRYCYNYIGSYIDKQDSFYKCQYS